MNDFSVAKFFIYVSIIVGYTCVLIGVAFLVIFFNDGLSAWAGAGIAALTGLIIVAIGQMGLAQIATAENTHQTNVLLQKLFSQMQSDKPKPFSATTPQPISKPPKEEPAEPSIKHEETYKGYEIRRGLNSIIRHVGDKDFDGVLAARKYIDHLTNNKD